MVVFCVVFFMVFLVKLFLLVLFVVFMMSPIKLKQRRILWFTIKHQLDRVNFKTLEVKNHLSCVFEGQECMFHHAFYLRFVEIHLEIQRHVLSLHHIGVGECKLVNVALV